MTTPATAYLGARIFDGTALHVGRALIVEGGRVVGIVGMRDIPTAATRVSFDGGTIAPGFVDIQVNGGGGLMLNGAPTVDTLRVMAAAHARLGATTILPTLITDTPEVTRRAIAAVERAIVDGVPGIAGLHLEGPHLSQARKGAHDPALIRPMGAGDVEILCDAARRLPVLMVTLAPENVTSAQIRQLADAGIVLSLGHSDCSYPQALAAADSGVACVTHLFNAMSQLGNRAPGLVGAALNHGALSAGLIADLIHVHPVSLALALAAKQGPGRLFLVSDAMAVAGTELDGFTLNGRRITRRNGRLTLQDGTLAGADLDLATAVANVVGLDVAPERALAMATAIPAQVIGRGGECGALRPGRRADFILLRDDLSLDAVWRAGVSV